MTECHEYLGHVVSHVEGVYINGVHDRMWRFRSFNIQHMLNWLMMALGKDINNVHKTIYSFERILKNWWYV